MSNQDVYHRYASLFKMCGLEDYHQIASCWKQSHRFYHNEGHLIDLIQKIEQSDFIGEEKEALILIAFFHDIVCDPKSSNNEEDSANIFEKWIKNHPRKELIKKIILGTRSCQYAHPLAEFFYKIDRNILAEGSLEELLRWEKKIFKEHQWCDYSIYRTKRISLLHTFVEKYPQNRQNLNSLIQYLEVYQPNIGVYAGSFNPFHIGHMNILQKAEAIFDKVIIAIGNNPEKNTIQETKLPHALHYRQIAFFNGMLSDFLSSLEKEASITLIRGLRNGNDLAYEMNQFKFMQDLKPDLKMVFIACDRAYEHISSSAIRNLDKIGEGYSKPYLP